MKFSGQYLTFEEYINLGGSLTDEKPFNILEKDSRNEIDKYTFGRLKDLKSQNEDVKLCMYKIMNKKLSYIDKEDKNNISSESIDGYSVSYNTDKANDNESQQKEIKDIIYTYLAESKLEDGTPYLYRGLK